MSGRSGPIVRAVVIGASAGAVDALSAILPSLPKDFPLSLMVVVHLPADKKSILAELLGAKCQVQAVEVEDQEPIRPGVVYFAPPDYHLLVESEKLLALSSEEPVLYSRPSIDVLFESAADVYGTALVGIVLTGANSDGAAGLKAVHRAGGAAIVQRPDLAVASAMPQAALEACPSAQAMTLEEIAAYLCKLAEAV